MVGIQPGRVPEACIGAAVVGSLNTYNSLNSLTIESRKHCKL